MPSSSALPALLPGAKGAPGAGRVLPQMTATNAKGDAPTVDARAGASLAAADVKMSDARTACV